MPSKPARQPRTIARGSSEQDTSGVFRRSQPAAVSMRDHARKVLEHQQEAADAAEHSDAVPVTLPPDPAFVAEQTGYKVRKLVTVPVLPFPVGSAIVCRMLEAIRESDVDDGKMGKARVCQIEAPNGEVRILIVGEVLFSSITRAYSEDSYVGHWFHITKLPPREGKRYADYAVAEIEPVSQSAAA